MRNLPALLAPALLALLPAMSLAAPGAAASTRAIAALGSWRAQPHASLDDLRLRLPLSREEAERAWGRLALDRQRELTIRYADAVKAQKLTIGDKTLRWTHKDFGNAAPGQRSLWISLHGGGNAPAEVNDGQWQNQLRLYEPAEGIYLTPRAPTDTWNLWHEAHIDPLLQELIDAQVAVNGVDPDKVFLMGYSAGGDGVWQLAPRMADRFAAAAMMAGHPGDASLLPLRNLPFAIFVGGDDAAYDRNKLGAEKAAELDRLAAADPGGYVHMSRIYPRLPHWMNRKDAEAVPWMAHYRRNPWPARVIWVQDDVRSDRFYWLKIPAAATVKPGDTITASVVGHTITLSGAVPAGTMLRLSDRLLDLDRPVRVVVNGRTVHNGKVPRTARAIAESLRERFDPNAVATASLTVG
ncbi:alpha/beta hydrolase [Sphingomonas sp. 8AM]|uniref:alpha/beta hydrolase n=1 Tax=Sphingomonas sp. 8AM TaxID=2653170 RepID=UPI0012F0CA9F|nr:alpha/beta hydrolase [Sphingomonas sp. 8AM]VXC86842.1 Esterase/PHB depolymerase [Sphingomonas sp. 8AM]